MWQCVNGKDIIRNTWWMSCSHFSAGTQLLDVSVEWSIILILLLLRRVAVSVDYFIIIHVCSHNSWAYEIFRNNCPGPPREDKGMDGTNLYSGYFLEKFGRDQEIYYPTLDIKKRRNLAEVCK